MQTLLSSPKPPLHHHFPITTTTKTNPSLSPSPSPHPPKPKPFHLHATSKGFGSTTPTKTTNENGDKQKYSDKQNELPQAVFDRLVRRVLVAVGVPMVTGIVSMGLLGLLKQEGIWNVPKWVTAVTLLVTFGGSAVGIAYGPLSASWDEERSGSVFGFDEVERNWGRVWDESDDD